jgi:hypothetical protein
MNTQSRIALTGLLIVLGACSANEGQQPESVDINTTPLTLDEATESLTRISELQQVNPADPVALEALALVEARLDELNHLVARIEPEPGHIVSFYESTPGIIGIGERGPAGSKPVIAAEMIRGLSVTELYLELSGREAPAALRQAAERSLSAADAEAARRDIGLSDGRGTLETDALLPTPAAHDGVASARQALTAADAAWYRDNGCFKTGDARACLPDWAGGGYSEYYTKTSFINVAPFQGDWVQVRLKYSGTVTFTTSVNNGEWHQFWAHSSKESNCCTENYDYNRRTHRWDILQASNDRFHWSYSNKWTCVDWVACNAWP